LAIVFAKFSYRTISKGAAVATAAPLLYDEVVAYIRIGAASVSLLFVRTRGCSGTAESPAGPQRPAGLSAVGAEHVYPEERSEDVAAPPLVI